MAQGESLQRAGPRRYTRREFLKLGAMAGVAAGLAGMGVASALGFVKAPQEPLPPWQTNPDDPTYVDYSRVPYRELTGPTPNILKVAQWYDYWPGSFLDDFQKYMKRTYDMDVFVQQQIYTSNEELFTWITIGRQSFDVFFPSNYVVDLMKHSGMVYQMNSDWIPNLANMNPYLIGVPRDNPFDLTPNGAHVSIPYFWGTTGVGFRSDRIPRADAEQHGMDFFWMSHYTPSEPGYSSVDLYQKMRMLDDERDVLGWGFKKAGWEEQRAKGLDPTGIPNNPAPPYNGLYQWTTNETAPARVKMAGDWLYRAKPNLFDFNSTEDASSLVSGAAYVNQAWSGDIMYARRPDQNLQLPIDYVIPIQGSTWWIDCAAIHSRSRNLWLAHEFINFTQDVKEHMVLTKWNLYSTPNQAVYEQLTPFPNGWDMAKEPILYPNLYDKEGWARLDTSGDVGLDALINLYNPLWFDLTAV